MSPCLFFLRAAVTARVIKHFDLSCSCVISLGLLFCNLSAWINSGLS